MIRIISRPTVALLIAYAVTVVAVLGVRPLWADELLQLTGAREGSWTALFHWAQILPGGTPLPLALQKLSIASFGWSNWALRLPAAFFGIASAALFVRLCQARLVPLALFLAMPMLFRYSTEARMYSEALFFVLLVWVARGRASRTVASVLALYSSPFTLFAILPLAPFAAIVSAIAFLPWVIRQHGVQQAQGSLAVYQFSWSQLLPGELSGGGYACTVPLLLLAGMGWRKQLWPMTAGAIMGPPLADAVRGYFFAARQWLFALPPLILAAGYASHLPAARCLLLIFFAGAAVKDVRQTFFAKEDWGAAAKAISNELSNGGCLVVAPREQLSYYSFYQPGLAYRLCATGEHGTIVLADSPYTTLAEQEQAQAGLRVSGAVKQKQVTVGTITMTTYNAYSR